MLTKQESIAHPLIKPIQLALGARLTLMERQAILWIGDMIALVTAGIIALWLWSFTRPQPFSVELVKEYAQSILVLATIWFFMAWVADLYHLLSATQLFLIFQRLFGIVATILVGYLLIFFSIAQHNILPRLPLLYFLANLLIWVGLWRLIYAKTLGRKAFQQRLLIIGANRGGQALAKVIQVQPTSHFEVLGFVDDAPTGMQVVGATTDLLKLALEQHADTIVYAIPHNPDPDMFHHLLDCQAAGLQIIRMPALYEALTGRIPIEHIGHDWFLPNEVGGGQATLTYRLFVRLLDLGFSLIAGLFLFLVGPIIALLIRLDSPGPIFYRQSRLGRGGQTFDLIKFRSMSVNAEKGTGAKWATKNDPRITRIGQILRRTRLDELPQILNILKGDIHLIGPRPERPEFTEQLEKEVPFYRARLAVKPGLTGWAQVKYRYGSSVDDTITKLQYDLYYIKHRSIMLNLLIILKTIGVVLSCKGT